MAATFFGFFGLLVLSWMILFRGQRTAYLMDNLGQFFSGLVAMTTCAVAARRHRQRWTGWALLAASLGIVVCGNGIWCYYHLIFRVGPSGSSSIFDITVALGLPLAIAGVLTLPEARGAAAYRLRGALDALLIGVAIFFIGWTLVLSPVYQHSSGGALAEIFNLGFAAGDLLLASLVISLATRARSHNRLGLSLVSTGLLSCAIADSSFCYLSALNRYGIGNVTDIGWVVGYLLVALGALWAWDQPVVPSDGSTRVSLRTLLGPNLPLLGVIVVVAVQVHSHHPLNLISQVSFAVVIVTLG